VCTFILIYNMSGNKDDTPDSGEIWLVLGFVLFWQAGNKEND